MARFKKIFSVVLFVAIAIIIANLFLYFFESYLIFKPKKSSVNMEAAASYKPMNVWIQSGKIKLNAWYFPQVKPKAIILYLHGNQGNLNNTYADLLKMHQLFSASVLSFDYEGFGQSSGYPEEKTMLQDAARVFSWLAQTEHVKANKIILFGRSLGGAVAIDLAAKFPAKGLIILSSFTSLPQVINFHYPFLFPNLLMRNTFNSLAKISSYHGPVLIIHSKDDELIPLTQAEKLFATANRPKDLQVVAGQHFDPISSQTYSIIKTFIEGIHS